MDDRILLSKLPKSCYGMSCDCGQPFSIHETVAMYPWMDEDGIHTDVNLREVFCLTCHFWIIHDVMESIGR